MMTKTFGVSVAAAALFGIASAHAAPFGPATASLGSFDVPTVTLGATSGTIKVNGGSAQLSAGTGNFAGATFAGSGSGTLTFNFASNTIVGNTIAPFFLFSDNAGGQYEFDLASVDTISYSNAPGVSTSISLYLLGTMFDTNLNLSPTATSLTFQVNSTGKSAFAESGSLSNPPAPPAPPPTVPEPASLTLLGAGLIGLGLVRRKARNAA